MRSSNIFSWVVLLTWISICLVTFCFNSSVILSTALSRRLGGMLFDLHNCPCFLNHNHGRNCWEHIHVILTSHDHSLLSVICLYLEENSGHHHYWRSNNWRSGNLHKNDLECERWRVEKCKPGLIFHSNNRDYHRRLICQIIRSKSFVWAVVSNERAICNFAWVLKMRLFWINIQLLAGTNCLDFLSFVVNSNILTWTVSEFNTKTLFLFRDRSSVFSDHGRCDSFFAWWRATHIW